MKKILISVIIFSFLPSFASAKSGPYFGININQSHAEHRISSNLNRFQGGDPFHPARAGGINGVTFLANRTTTDSKNIGFGFEYGYKAVLSEKGFFVAPEIFFDQLNNSAADPSSDDASLSVTKQDRLILNYRYGAKLNLGVDINDKFSFFITGGFANVDYDVQWNSGFVRPPLTSYGASKIAGLYGIGVEYYINENLSAKLTGDRQDFNIRYNLDGWRSNVDLTVVKFGLNYNF